MSYYTLDGASDLKYPDTFVVPTRVYKRLLGESEGFLEEYRDSPFFQPATSIPDNEELQRAYTEDPYYRLAVETDALRVAAVSPSGPGLPIFPSYEMRMGHYRDDYQESREETRVWGTGFDPGLRGESECDLVEGDNRCPAMAGFIGARNIDFTVGRYSDFSRSLLELIGANQGVNDLLAERLYIHECDGLFYAGIYKRPLKILALDIENVSRSPIVFRSVEGVYHEKNDLELSAWGGESERMTPVTYEFPPGVLAPGEHLLVPIAILIASFADYHSQPRSSNFARRHNGARLRVKRDYWLEVPEKPRLSLVDEYSLGSWLEIRTLNSEDHVRSFDAAKIVYHKGMGVGSCPFAYVYDHQRQSWVPIGTLISRNATKDREGLSLLPVPKDFEGRLLVREVESETSFLDRIVLLGTAEGGETVLFYPFDERLRTADEVYVVLNPGEEIVVEFDVGQQPSYNYAILSEGYFEPH